VSYSDDDPHSFDGACPTCGQRYCEPELRKLRAALHAVTDFAAEYAGGVHSDIGDPEGWEPMKLARAALAGPERA
jgi:hypothetical protein